MKADQTATKKPSTKMLEESKMKCGLWQMNPIALQIMT